MRRPFALIVAVLIAVPAAGIADVLPQAVPDLPVLGAQAHRGNDLVVSTAAAVAPTPKTVDGEVADWTGRITRFGGTAITSHGEYVYQDYLMDDWGADDGLDAERTATTDTLAATESRLYRIEALSQAAGDQFDAPPPAGSLVNYGDAAIPDALRDHADIEEVRVAADDTTLYVLVRTTGMLDADATIVSVFLDAADDGSFAHPAGITTAAELEVRAVGSTGRLFDGGVEVACGCVDVATNATGYVNAIEIGVDRAALGALPSPVRMAVATGVSADGATYATVRSGTGASDLVNVAFRFDEPARIWMDHDQGLALHAGTIEQFFAPIDLDRLEAGYTEAFEPRAGYYERVLETDSAVNEERTRNSYWQGSFQHYGIYFPSTFAPGRPTPATWWTHYRGGHAHDAAAWVPGLIRQLGEQRGNIVITPGARGTSSWYAGRGHEDFLDVWDDSMGSFAIDPDRVYMSGYSMGGFASWLLPLVYPDRFAASFPTAGPPTPGLWLGAGEPTGSQEGADVAAMLTYDVIRNAANVGYVIYQGSSDELVVFSGPTSMAAHLTELGYDNRLYLFPGAEHYTNAIYDEWTEAARYLDRFTRDPNPARVVYTVKPALERGVETMSNEVGAPLDYTFDGAYWVDGLVAAGDPTSAATLGTIDATTFGRGVPQYAGIPEAGTGGQITPHVMAGLRRQQIGMITPANRFTATLTGLSTATLDVLRMALSTSEPVSATITTDGPTTLLLAGSWSGPAVTGADASYSPGTLELTFAAAGTYEVTIAP